MIVLRTRDPMMAIGRSRFGFFASSLPVDDRVEPDVSEEDDRLRRPGRRYCRGERTAAGYRR